MIEFKVERYDRQWCIRTHGHPDYPHIRFLAKFPTKTLATALLNIHNGPPKEKVNLARVWYRLNGQYYVRKTKKWLEGWKEAATDAALFKIGPAVVQADPDTGIPMEYIQ